MVSIKFIDAQQVEHVVEVATGTTVMEAAVKNGVPGIVGECGGYCACGTCVATIDASWREIVTDPNFAEAEMLEFIEAVEAGQRLTCQICITEKMDGMLIRTPSKKAI